MRSGSLEPFMSIHGDADRAVRDQAKDWVVHLATGGATQGDLRALEEWRARSASHAEAFAEACRTWQALGSPLEAAATQRRPSALSAAPRIGRRAFVGGAIAAAAAATAGVAIVRPPFGLWPSATELAADHRTSTGEQRRIDLADASIEMNTRTSLNVRPLGEADIELISGETAVTTGPRRLVLLAAEGRTSAADAAFTVRCDGPNVRVTCLRGRARVVRGAQEAELPAGHQLSYGPAGIGAAGAVDPQAAAGWRDGVLVFDNERVSQVVDEVNRYRQGRLVLMNAALGEQQVTARFHLARLDAVLSLFREVLGAQVRPVAGGLVLLS